MSISKIAISTLILCGAFGMTASAAVFPSMPKAPHAAQTSHGTSHVVKPRKHK
jgi:hypothetical protein